MADAGFWSNQEQARAVVQQVKSLKSWVESFGSIEARLRSATELAEMLDAEPDDEMTAELDRDVISIARDLESFRLRSLLSGPDDARDVQLEIAAGAGGTEAQDWAEMLMRLYSRWAERKGFKIEILDMSEGEERSEERRVGKECRSRWSPYD